MNRRSASLSTNHYRSKFILRPSFQTQFILRPSFQTQFILRFDFLDITVLYSIGKRYNSQQSTANSQQPTAKAVVWVI